MRRWWCGEPFFLDRSLRLWLDDWWGHHYSWKRSTDKQLGLTSFHLLRDGNASAPVAHIVPETRSPSQVVADENAGGWVPPCAMWIADNSVVDAMTDVEE